MADCGKVHARILRLGKAAGFVFLTGLVAWEYKDTSGTLIGSLYSIDVVRWIGWSLVWSAVALTVIRAIPVFVDSIAFIRDLDEGKQPA